MNPLHSLLLCIALCAVLAASADPCLNNYGQVTFVNSCSDCNAISGCLWCESASVQIGPVLFSSGACISGSWRGPDAGTTCYEPSVCFSCSDWRFGQCGISSVVLYGLCAGAFALILITSVVVVICVRRRRRVGYVVING